MSKKLKLRDIVGLSLASFVSLELIASFGAVGPSIIITMLIFGGLYYVLHAAIAAELGSKYPDQGGLYVWTKKAFGNKWAARTSWWYWINVVAFVPSTLVVSVTVFQQLFWPDMSVLVLSLLSVGLLWIVIFFNTLSLNESKLLTNTGSILKIVLVVVLVVSGIFFLIDNGSATEFTASSFIPTFDYNFFWLIPVFVLSLSGIDLVSCNADRMENPGRNVPKALAIVGVISMSIYLIGGVGIQLILDASSIDVSSGLIDAFIIIFGANKILVALFGISMVIVFLSYVFSWAIGANAMAYEAAQEGEFPAVFKKTNKHDAPVGAALVLGIASTVVLIGYGLLANTNEGLFWSLLAFSSIIFFMPYLVMSAVLVKMRKIDTEVKSNIFEIPGKNLPMIVSVLHFIALSIAIVAFMLPPEGEDPLVYTIALIGGLIVFLTIPEYYIRKMKVK